MKNKLFKIIKILFFICIILCSLIILLFYRRDLSVTRLEKTYFTENSHYMDVTISSLEGEVLNIKVHYQDYGNPNDEVIMLLHGAFSSSHTFIPWALRLVEENYRVILIDLPYHGLTGCFSDHVTSLRRSSETVKALLSELEISSLYIGGNSMGGGVSWYFAGSNHEHNFDIKGLVLIDSVYPSTDGGRRDDINFLSRPLISRFVSKMTPRFLLKYILEGVYGSDSTLEESTIDRYYDLLRKRGNRQAILRNTNEPMNTSELENLLTMIHESSIPVLIMWGKEDTWIPVSTVSQFESVLPDAQVIVYEGLGHVPMEENPLLTVEDLMIFLNE